MNSKQIQSQIEKAQSTVTTAITSGRQDIAQGALLRQALYEIAYQLAVHNEREQASSSVDWQEFCECAHKRCYHHTTGCSFGGCKCEGWRAA